MESNSIEGFINVRKNGEIIPLSGELLFMEDAWNGNFPLTFTITHNNLSYFDETQYNNTVFRVLLSHYDYRT